MISLLDISPAVATVKVRGGELEVRGVSAESIAKLLGRFPEIGGLLSGGDIKLDAASITTVVPKAVRVIIAAGCGHAGEEEWEAAADNLTAEEQADAIAKIVELTMPSGLGPFVGKLRAIMAGAAPGPRTGKAPASHSPKQ